MIQLLISPLLILISLSTSAGVLLHETKVDKLATLVLSHPVIVAKKLTHGKMLESMPHTHSDIGTFEASSRQFRAGSHGMTPRRDRDEKYRLQKQVPRGYHLFDSYHLPLEALAK